MTNGNTIRLGKIGYRNVLPIYHPLEQGMVPGSYEIVSGPPAELNRRMAAGELDVSSVSCIEYARRPEEYYLVPDLAIGSRGPVQSVLLLSRVPVEKLAGQTVLVSAQTHTSAALLRILFREYRPMDVRFVTGDATACLARGDCPQGMLAIGDEALSLRGRADYPYTWDLGEVWRAWTGLPFIFGVWVVRRDFAHQYPERCARACAALLDGKEWGQAHLDRIAELASGCDSLSQGELKDYFAGLVYDLRGEEEAGLLRFFRLLHKTGEIGRVPELAYFALARREAESPLLRLSARAVRAPGHLAQNR